VRSARRRGAWRDHRADETGRIEIRRLEGIPALIGLLSSPSESVQENSTHALFQCSLNGARQWSTRC
jgi:hypothetical protein